jgi:hypothetical protein
MGLTGYGKYKIISSQINLVVNTERRNTRSEISEGGNFQEENSKLRGETLKAILSCITSLR